MSLLSRAFERRAIDGSSFNVAIDAAPRSKAGASVTFDTAIGVAVAWRCLTLIADTAFHLPVDTFERQRDGTQTPVSPGATLVENPSLLVSGRDWRYQGLIALGAFGNSYGIVLERDQMLRPTAVEWVNPESVTVEQANSLRAPAYRIGGQVRNAEEVVHVRRYPKPGSVVGMAPLARQRETIGLAIALRDYAAQWFGDGAHPSSLLLNDKDLGDKDGKKAQAVKNRFMEAVRGKREPVVMGGGWKHEAIQGDPQSSETTEITNLTALAVCQVFGVPPEKVGVASQGSSLTYANRQDRAIDFLTDTMLPWLTVFEDFWTSNLPDRQFAKFNTDALLRADLLTRYRAHDSAIRAGWKNRNEAREHEDLPPIPADQDGDEYLWPPYRAFPLESDIKGDD